MFPGIITIFTFQDKGGRLTRVGKATTNNAAAAARAGAGVGDYSGQHQTSGDNG